ncbi:entry exclusion lipoprotein TrbK [Serratia marcescens]|uniref:entry exclusion lipoprotein TrbK n=1 Tax=Serratia marcescens TaxID=615 RepID=UPI0009A50794|nr:entry exclusion lipoprotein TrbK [Serratia marcescens]OPJ92718.1 entry exclusion lipoprotein TrbK [Serratia marcescens]
MNVKIYIVVIFVGVLVAGAGFSIFGESQEQMPEVNEQNCQPETISKIRDSGLREDFSGKCFWLHKPGKSSGKGY